MNQEKHFYLQPFIVHHWIAKWPFGYVTPKIIKLYLEKIDKRLVWSLRLGFSFSMDLPGHKVNERNGRRGLKNDEICM